MYEGFPRIARALKTCFNSEDGLSLEAAKRLLVQSVAPSQRSDFSKELLLAFADSSLSWKAMLANADYEVMELETEWEARSFAYELLCEPFQDIMEIPKL